MYVDSFSLLYSTIICRCKTCVKHVYCNELCRDSAWAEFQQWECLAVRAGMVFINHHGYLTLCIIFKPALSVGFSVSDVYNLPRKDIS